MTEYERRAFAEVGLTAWDALRLRGEHDCESAGEGTILLDLEERQRLMRAIAGTYASLFLRAPDAFLWMGFAAVAIHDGVRPASELAAAAARSAWLDATQRGVVGRALTAVLGTTPAAVVYDAMKAAFEANFAIFADLAWVHLAYLDGGVALLRELAVDGALVESFAKIERGDVIAGNLGLFRREQEHTVTPVFEKYPRAMAAAARLGLIAVPNEQLRESGAVLGRPQDWLDPAVSFGPFAARWRWLVASSWEPFVRLHRERRGALHREVMRAIVES